METTIRIPKPLYRTWRALRYVGRALYYAVMVPVAAAAAIGIFGTVFGIPVYVGITYSWWVALAAGQSALMLVAIAVLIVREQRGER